MAGNGKDSGAVGTAMGMVWVTATGGAIITIADGVRIGGKARIGIIGRGGIGKQVG